MKKGLLFALAMVMAVCVGIGGTIAYLSVSTQEIVNTFVYGDINITLTESETNFDETDNTNANANTYKMIPGNTLSKDPKVTVKAVSEACWLFVTVEKENNPDKYLDYTINSCWMKLDGVEDVYYYKETDLDNLISADKTYSILTGDAVTVKTTVTKTDMMEIGTNYPTLTFTAYAVQKANVTTVEEAWELAKSKGVPVTNASN